MEADGTYQLASCAVLGVKLGSSRTLNPMILASVISAYLAKRDLAGGSTTFVLEDAS